MFSGLVEAKTQVTQLSEEPGGIRLGIARPESFSDIQLGDSIAIDGCCLTVVAATAGQLGQLEFQAGEETLSKTTLGQLKTGMAVNSERAMALGDRIGGHLVSGHIDGLGTLRKRKENAEWCDMWFDCPPALTAQMAPKGSIAVNGVSLTLVEVDNNGFSVALIPHTLEHTTLGDLQIEQAVNLETDMLAKYVQRQLEFRS
ncbi:MAG: riboflavin synthase [Aureliella sp.]